MQKIMPVLLLALITACAEDTISRERWQAMSTEDKVLYVNTLIGAEKTRDAKGDRGLTVTRTPEQYVQAIELAYDRGETRPVHELFAELSR